MDDFEMAVLLCLDASADAAARGRAFAYCDQLRSSPDAWRFCVARLAAASDGGGGGSGGGGGGGGEGSGGGGGGARPPPRPEARFWCLAVLHDALVSRTRPLVDTDRAAVRSCVTAQLRSAAVAASPAYVRNKLAQLYATLIAADYPASWPGAFSTDLVTLSRDAGGRDAFFRILRAVDEDVTSVRAASAAGSRVKDGMREDCIPGLVATWASTVAAAAAPGATAADMDAAIAALDLVRRYAQWVDIGLFLTNDLLRVIYAALTGSAPALAPLAAASAAALSALVAKRMAPSAKASLLAALQLRALLPALATELPPQGAGEAELGLRSATVEVANLVNTVATVAIGLVGEAGGGGGGGEAAAAAAEATALVETALPVALRYIANEEDEDVAAQTLEFISAYVSAVRKAAEAAGAAAAASMGGGDAATAAAAAAASRLGTSDAGLREILRVVKEVAAYPPDYDPEDGAAACGDLRESLVTLLKNTARAAPAVVLASVEELASGLLTADVAAAGTPPPSAKDEAAADGWWNTVRRTELLLRLLIALQELSSELGEPLTCRLSPVICAVLASPPSVIAAAAVAPVRTVAEAHQLDEVAVTFLDLAARSYREVGASSGHSLLSAVLPIYFDSRGLDHPSPRVRSRAAALLLKLIRPLRSAIASRHLGDVLPALVPRIFPLAPAGSPASADQDALLDTAGLLLGVDPGAAATAGYLTSTLAPIIEGLRAAAAAARASAGGTSANGGAGAGGFDAAAAQRWIAAAAQLSKGFCARGTPGDGGSSGAGSPGGGPGADGWDGGPADANEVLAAAAAAAAGTSPGATRPPFPEAVLAPWRAACEAVLALSAAAGPAVQARTLTFLHRMVETLGEVALPFIAAAMDTLVSPAAATPAELNAVVVLVNQVVSRFRSSAAPVAAELYLPLCARVAAATPTLDPDRLMAVAEADRERVELHRNWLLFIHGVLVAGLGGEVLGHPARAHALQPLVAAVVAAAVGDGVDVRVGAAVSKLAFTTLARMVVQWAPPPPVKPGGGAGAARASTAAAAGAGAGAAPAAVGATDDAERGAGGKIEQQLAQIEAAAVVAPSAPLPGFGEYVVAAVAPACVASAVRNGIFRSSAGAAAPVGGGGSRAGATPTAAAATVEPPVTAATYAAGSRGAGVMTANVLLQVAAARRLGDPFIAAVVAPVGGVSGGGEAVRAYAAALAAPEGAVPSEELVRRFVGVVVDHRQRGGR
ncbi:hypothetical protein MMPV_009012 [Pyropia vietnamensis]